jgi:hypothetical protein
MLLAAVVERARLDAKGARCKGDVGSICAASIHKHRAMVCANEFLLSMNKAISYDGRPTTGDIVQAYLEVTE